MFILKILHFLPYSFFSDNLEDVLLRFYQIMNLFLSNFDCFFLLFLFTQNGNKNHKIHILESYKVESTVLHEKLSNKIKKH